MNERRVGSVCVVIYNKLNITNISCQRSLQAVKPELHWYYLETKIVLFTMEVSAIATSDDRKI
jgi:hypothetical protein